MDVPETRGPRERRESYKLPAPLRTGGHDALAAPLEFSELAEPYGFLRARGHDALTAPLEFSELAEPHKLPKNRLGRTVGHDFLETAFELEPQPQPKPQPKPKESREPHELYKAALRGEISVVKSLIAGGFDINKSIDVTRTVNWGNPGFLFGEEPPPDYSLKYEGYEVTTGETALHAAAKSGGVECLKFLLRNGAAISIDIYGQTPLMCALEKEENEEKYFECAKLLLEAGDNPNAKTDFCHALGHIGEGSDYTPLQMCVKSKRAEMIILLLSFGANLISIFKDGDLSTKFCLLFNEVVVFERSKVELFHGTDPSTKLPVSFEEYKPEEEMYSWLRFLDIDNSRVANFLLSEMPTDAIREFLWEEIFEVFQTGKLKPTPEFKKIDDSEVLSERQHREIQLQMARYCQTPEVFRLYLNAVRSYAVKPGYRTALACAKHFNFSAYVWKRKRDSEGSLELTASFICEPSTRNKTIHFLVAESFLQFRILLEREQVLEELQPLSVVASARLQQECKNLQPLVLDCTNMKVDISFVQALVNLNLLTFIRSIDFSSCAISDESIKKIAPSLLKINIQILILKKNELSYLGVLYLIGQISENHALELLDVEENLIFNGRELLDNLVKELKKPSNFLRINVSNNFLKEECDPFFKKDTDIAPPRWTYGPFYSQLRECESLLVDKATVSEAKWRVCLVCKEKTQHAMLFIEGMRLSGQKFIKKVHITTSSLLSSKGKADIIDLTPKRLFYELEQYHKQSWEINRAQGITLLGFVDEDIRNGVDFSLTATASRGKVNCLEWAFIKLEAIDLKVERTLFPSTAAKRGKSFFSKK